MSIHHGRPRHFTDTLEGHNTHHRFIWVNIFQNEIMVEFFSKSLVRAIGKVLHIEFS